MKEYYDASEVRQEIKLQIEKIIKDLYPEAKKEGNDYRIGNLDGEKGKSLSISCLPEGFGKWHDFASGEKGDIINLIKQSQNLNYGGAISYLAKKYTNLKPVERNFGKKTEVKKVELTEYIVGLTDACKKYAIETRGISEKTLIKYKVCSSKFSPDTEIAFVSLNKDNIPVKIHFSNIIEKGFRSSPDPAHSLWGTYAASPDETNGNLVITEGQWDALSYAEAEIKAVSIPSGVSNHKWIEEDYEYLQQFHTFYLSFDMDEAGQKAMQVVIKRLGVHRCKIVNLDSKDNITVKDANDVLRAFGPSALIEAISSAQACRPNQIVTANDVREETWELLSQDKSAVGTPFFLEGFKFRERAHECTIVFGYTGHGKSEVVQNQVAYNAYNGRSVMIGSFEQNISFTLAAIAQAYSNTEIFVSRAHYDAVIDKLTENLIFFDDEEGKPTAQELVNAFIYAYKRYGTKCFVIDNIMTMAVDRSDNGQQAETSNVFRQFVKKYPVHLYLVAHPRKAGEAGYAKAPHEQEIMGAGEWANMAQNIITVWRNKEKEDNLNDTINQGGDRILIQQIIENHEDSRIIIRKQRFTGKTDFKKMWFKPEVKRFTTSYFESGQFNTEQ